MDSNCNSEIRELLVGCREHSDAAFEELVLRYTPMLNSVIASKGLDCGEAFSEACMALYKAALLFDLEQDEVTFGLYAKVCVTNRLTDLTRRVSGTPVLSDLDVDSISVSDGTLLKLEKQEERAAFHLRASEVLSEYEYRVLTLWLGGYKTADIASAVEADSKSVDNAKARILKKLRRAFAE